MRRLRRIGRDLRSRRHVEIYAVAAVSIVLAILSLVGDVAPDGLRWAAVLAALSLLTYQIALPKPAADLDDVLRNRAAFDEMPFVSRLQGARDVWIVAPTAVNLLTADTVEHLRRHVLSRREGQVRVQVLDPERPEALALARQQLDQATDYPALDLTGGLAATLGLLETMAGWDVAGTFEYRFTPYNPGFSVVAIDPHAKGGLLILELHGVRNESIATRMHVELTRASSEHWFVYWRDQMHHLWDGGRQHDR